MPTATVDTARVNALIGEAATAAGSQLCETVLLAGNVGEGTLPEEFVPGPGSRAVACKMKGLDGRMIIMVSERIARQVLEGPLGNQDFAVALEQALQRAAVILDQAAPRALRIDAAQEVDPNVEMAAAGHAWWWGAAPLFDQEEHEGSFVVLLDDPATVGLLTDVDDDDDDAYDSSPASGGPDMYNPPQAPAAGQPGMGQMPGMFGGGGGGSSYPLQLLHDVEMDVTVELGRTRMTVRSILGLSPGAVIELDRAAGAPVDLLVNGTLIGRGEVVVIDEEFGVRISEIIGRPDDPATK
jgi:flagellar motor switch protein FliN